MAIIGAIPRIMPFFPIINQAPVQKNLRIAAVGPALSLDGSTGWKRRRALFSGAMVNIVI